MVDGYACANCNIGFKTRRERNNHMVDAHNSPFVEGDDRDINDSKARSSEKKNTKAQEALRDAGHEVN